MVALGLEASALIVSSTFLEEACGKALSGEDAEKLMRLLESLEDNDDVQKVHANWEMSDELLEKVTT